jgi:predicted transcriptional regulator
MAKSLRFKQPAFDPSELNDLIFSPAVGTGVSSHLLAKSDRFPSSLDQTTKPGQEPGNLSTVGISKAAQIFERMLADTLSKPNLSTVVTRDLATVYESQRYTVDRLDQERDISDALVTDAQAASQDESHSSLLSTESGNPAKSPLPPEGEAVAPFSNLPTVHMDDLPTVDRSKSERDVFQSPKISNLGPTLDHEVITQSHYMSTVDTSFPELRINGLPCVPIDANLVAGTVTRSSDLSTVDINPLATVDTSETRQFKPISSADQSTVNRSNVVIPDPRALAKIWITENGDPIPAGRVKRIRLAQDVINSAEESVYDTLWTATKGSVGEERESFRVAQAGYDYLAKRTRLARKTIQRIIAKLIEKDFIKIERPADIYERTSTVYRIFSYKAVLERHLQRGRTHVAKVGPGFSYVKQLSDPRAAPEMATVVTLGVSTVADATTVTMAKMDLPTVVEETSSHIDNKHLTQTTTASLAEALKAYGTVDDDATTRLLRDCRSQSPDCTEEEILHFIQEKGRLTKLRDSRIQNPIGFLIDAVPKCFAGESLKRYRQMSESQQAEDQGLMPTIAEQIESLERFLELFPDHSQADTTRRHLADLKNHQASERV